MLKIVVVMVLFYCGVMCVQAQVYSFELHDKNSSIQAPSSRSIELSNDVKFKGKPSIRFELQRFDTAVANGKRAEIMFRPEKSLPVDRWYVFSIWLPKDYAVDSLPEIVAQWHAVPDFSLGETWRSPPIALTIQNGMWLLETRWASEAVNSNNTLSGLETVCLGNTVDMRWTGWVFHIKFDYKNTGILEVWRDGVKCYYRRGPNYYNDQTGPFFKFGIYKWDWNNNQIQTSIYKRVLYFGGVKLGESNMKIGDFLKEK